MQIARCLAAPLGAVVLLVAPFARADLTPAGAETCTIESQQKAGETCVKCAASFKRADTCRESYEAQGYKQRCKTRGASVWSEIWCRASGPASDAATAPTADGSAAPAPAPSAAAAVPPGTTPPPGKAGCGACTLQSVGGTTPWLLGAFAALVWFARRARGMRAPD